MKDNTKRLIAAMNFVETTSLLLDMTIKDARRIIELATGLPPHPMFDVFVATAKEETIQNFPLAMAELYEATFSDEEIDELIKFYESPVNQKLFSLMSEVQKIGQKVTEAFTQKVTSQFLSYKEPDGTEDVN